MMFGSCSDAGIVLYWKFMNPIVSSEHNNLAKTDRIEYWTKVVAFLRQIYHSTIDNIRYFRKESKGISLFVRLSTTDNLDSPITCNRNLRAANLVSNSHTVEGET